MQIHAINDFAAPVEAVFAMLTDRTFLRAVCLATDPLQHDVTVVGLQTSTRRVMPTPSVVKRFAGPTLTIVDHISWDAAAVDGIRHGRTLVTVEGMPAEVVGTVTLAPGGRGSLLTYEGELTIRVPVLGPSLARQASPALLDALDVQQRVGDEFLAGRAPAAP
ncbi:MAG: DUF2505 domain-containing protein [Propionicimonas sp.]